MILANWLPWVRLGLASRQGVIRERILNNPYCRLQTWAEVAVAAELGLKIDVNRAQVDDWLRLPGISIHQARSLVELTSMGVQFLCVEDLAAALSVPGEQIEPLKPVLHFRYYDPESSSTPQQVNPNTASAEQLAQIPILDESLAAKIVQNRHSNGAFRNLADLGQRLSLNSEMTAQLMYYLRF
ncbi:MAG: helix-hairpin-helix domain-containing protein [Cyanophyceae cyanobacterium]